MDKIVEGKRLTAERYAKNCSKVTPDLYVFLKHPDGFLDSYLKVIDPGLTL